MKQYFILTLLVSFLYFSTSKLYSQNVISYSGNINSDTIWAADTIKITGNVIINPGARLTISSKSVIEFQGHYKIIILGSIEAIGTKTDVIVFTAKDHQKGWHGLRFLNNPTDVSELSNCRFEYGNAFDEGSNRDKNGGAILAYLYSNINIVNSVFIHNKATYGGAISATNSKLLINGCEFNNNTAGYYAGAIEASYSTLKLINCLIINNSSLNGGALGLTGTVTSFLINNTICFNSASRGGALYCDASPIIKNTILWGNTATISGNQLFLQDIWGVDSEPQFYNCDVEGGKEAFGLDTYTNPEYIFYYETFSNIDSNPMFGETTLNDYSLNYDSPCINSGTTNFSGFIMPEHDISGNARILGSTIDMGAYEQQTFSGIQNSDVEFIINIYPNPCKDLVTIKCLNNPDDEVNFNIIDTQGRILLTKVIRNQTMVDITQIKSGLYVFNLKNDKFSINKLILIK